MDFYQFFNKINGEPYTDVPPPVPYELRDYGKDITSGPISGVSHNSHELRPLTDEDMGRYAADDVVDHYYKLHQGKNPNRLGDQLSDEEFKKFCGQGW